MITLYPHSIAALTLAPLRAAWAARERVAAAWATWWEAVDAASDVFMCECPPCLGRGNDGHGMTHCAECCFGSGVEADLDCPVHGGAA